jgi:hypothetical protein
MVEEPEEEINVNDGIKRETLFSNLKYRNMIVE